MTKYRIRLDKGRVIGPFELSQIKELNAKGYIKGTEEAQIFPTGSWEPLRNFEFYSELSDTEQTAIINNPLDETFVVDVSMIRDKRNERELEQLDVSKPIPVVEAMTQTVRIEQTKQTVKKVPPTPPRQETKVAKTVLNSLAFDLQPDAAEAFDVNAEPKVDATVINPVAQQELQRLRKKEEAEKKKAKSEEQKKQQAQELALVPEKKDRTVIAANESTQMFQLDTYKDNLLEVAQASELEIVQEEKDHRRKLRETEKQLLLEDRSEEDPADESAKKKKKKIIYVVVGLALLYALLFPSDDSGQSEKFVHLDPQVKFPQPFDVADPTKSKLDLQKAQEFYLKGTYPNIVRAGLMFNSSYENSLENQTALGMLVRAYGEQLQYSKNKKQDSQTLFNIIRSKRPFLDKDPNGVIGINLFYLAINKVAAAESAIAQYLKLNAKNVTPDLFAVYLQTLIRAGKLDRAQQFFKPLERAPDKNHYTIRAIVDYLLLNQQDEEAQKYIDDGVKRFPHLVQFYLLKSDLLLKQKKMDQIEPLLKKVKERNFEHNEQYRAKYLEIVGMLLTYKKNYAEATKALTASLAIKESDELRMRLAELTSSASGASETDKLILESKARRFLLQAQSFYEKRNFDLALSSAARAVDTYDGLIGSGLFLAKVQLRLGLSEQGLKTLEELVKKYPSDPQVNFAMIEAYVNTYKFNLARNRIANISATEMRKMAEYASLNAKLQLKMGDSLQAISWLKNSIALDPLNDGDIFAFAEILIKRANFDAARSLLNKCIELDPSNPDYRIAYSKIVYETQDDQAAVGYLLGLIEEMGEDPKIMGEIAIFYYRAGKVKDFMAYKEKIENLPYRDKALYEFLIRAALLDERYDEIPGLVEKLLEVEPGDMESMMTAGKVLFENGKLVEAAKWFRRIQEKLFSYPKVQYYIAKIKYLSTDLDGAMKEVLKDIKDNGENDATLVLMGQIHVDKKEFLEAENAFKKAQKINRNSYDALMGMADLSTKRNNFELALDLYQRAMKERNDEPVIHKKVGDVYRLLGEGTLAIESYKLYLEMNPEASDKKQIDDYIEIMQ